MVLFNKFDHSLLLVFVVDNHHCLTILKMAYLLHEDPMALLAPTNHLNNAFESILDDDVPYSIVVENITARETRDMFKYVYQTFVNEHYMCSVLF